MKKSQVFKAAHAATKNKFVKANSKEQNKWIKKGVYTYRDAFKYFLKWAWKEGKKTPKEFTKESVLLYYSCEGVLKETAKAICFSFTRRNHSSARVWMPKSAFGSTWGESMLQKKLDNI